MICSTNFVSQSEIVMLDNASISLRDPQVSHMLYGASVNLLRVIKGAHSAEPKSNDGSSLPMICLLYDDRMHACTIELSKSIME